MDQQTYDFTDLNEQQANLVIAVMRAKRASLRVWDPDSEVAPLIKQEREDVKSTLEELEGQYNEQATSG